MSDLLKKEISFTLNADKKTKLFAGLFSIFLFIFEIVSFKTTFIEFFGHFYRSQDYLFITFCAVGLLISFYLSFLFILLTLNSNWIFKPIYLSIFSVAVFAEYGYQKALNRFTDYIDVEAIISATQDQKIDSSFYFLNYKALIPIIFFLLLCFAVSKCQRNFGHKHLIFFLICIFCFYASVSYFNQNFVDRRLPNISLGAFFQSTADFAIYGPFFDFSPKVRNKIKTPTGIEKIFPNNNIIFVFDESIRPDHLSLNGYARKTTPFLEELQNKNLLKNFGTAVSSATSSHPSYDAMITGIVPESITEETNKTISSTPTIFQFAKAMNYKTHYFDGQMKKYWGGISDDINYIDNIVTLSELDSPDRIEDYQTKDKTIHADDGANTLKQWQIDEKIAKLVNEIYTNSTGNFIFIYKRGAHFPYEKNYPLEQAKWTPIYRFQQQYEIPPDEAVQSVVNSYDNAIYYNLDRFFKALAGDYSNLPNKTVIIYASDHGEIFETNGRASHGGTLPEEAEIPLFMLGKFDHEIDTEYKASHANIFTTLLDLMNYPEELRGNNYALSLLKAKASDSKPRFYSSNLQNKFQFDQISP